jgi:hypothetical protein
VTITTLEPESVDARRRRAAHERLANGTAPKNLKHGTTGTYDYWGCRCVPCTAAHGHANAVSRIMRKR